MLLLLDVSLQACAQENDAQIEFAGYLYAKPQRERARPEEP